MATATATAKAPAKTEAPAAEFRLENIEPHVRYRMPLAEQTSGLFPAPVTLLLRVTSGDLDLVRQAEHQAEADERQQLSQVEFNFLETDPRPAKVRQLEGSLLAARAELTAAESAIRVAETAAWQAIDQGADPSAHERAAGQAGQRAAALRGRVHHIEGALADAKDRATAGLNALLNGKRAELRAAAEAERDARAERFTEIVNQELLPLYLAMVRIERLAGRLDGPRDPAILLAPGVVGRGGFEGRPSSSGAYG